MSSWSGYGYGRNNSKQRDDYGDSKRQRTDKSSWSSSYDSKSNKNWKSNDSSGKSWKPKESSSGSSWNEDRRRKEDTRGTRFMEYMNKNLRAEDWSGVTVAPGAAEAEEQARVAREKAASDFQSAWPAYEAQEQVDRPEQKLARLLPSL